MDLSDLKAFLDVAHHGSFQAAAVALRVPRSRLRRQVERLEKSTEAPLFHRTAVGVGLTPAGESLAALGGEVLESANAALAAARGAQRGRRTLHVVMPVGFPLALRVRGLTTLAQLDPNLHLQVTELDQPLTYLRQPFDLLIHVGELVQRDGLYSRVMRHIPVGLFAARSYLDAAGRPTQLADLEDHRLLTWRPDPGLLTAWPLSGGGDTPIAPMVSSAHEGLIRAATMAGLGIGLLPLPTEPAFQGVDEHEELEAVLPGVIGGRLTFRLLSRLSSREHPALGSFLENLQALLDAMEAMDSVIGGSGSHI